MDNKIALITGGNRGLGLETARQLGRQGVHVVIAARKRGRGVEAALQLQLEGLSVEALELDVANSASIAAAAKEFAGRHARLDILINNAGIVEASPGKASEQSIADWRRIFDINLFGLVEVTQAFLPLLHKSRAGRIVNLSSILASNTLHSTPGSPIYDMKNIPAYNVSKSAVNAWTVQLAYELRSSPLKVYAVHPGYVKTEMNRGGGEMEIPDGARSAVMMALRDDAGPSGSFTHLGETLPW